MMLAEQDSNHFTDPAVPELILCGVLEAASTGRWDFGDGWVAPPTFAAGALGPQPAHQDCRFEILGRHRLLVAVLPWRPVLSLLDETGISGDPYGPLYGRMLTDLRGIAALRAMWWAMKGGGPANSLAVDGHVHTLLAPMPVAASSELAPPPGLDNPRLACESKLSVTGIALADGFGSAARFAKVFGQRGGRPA